MARQEAIASYDDSEVWNKKGEISVGDKLEGFYIEHQTFTSKFGEGKITWGQAMNDYADSWVSKKTGNTVFFGWTHGSGYGLFAGDVIEKIK